MLIELAAMLRSCALRWEGLLSRAALSADWIARAPGSNSYWAWGLSLSPETQSVPLRILRLALSALLVVVGTTARQRANVERVVLT